MPPKPPTTTVLRQILLLQRDVPRAAAFYEHAIGLSVRACTDAYAELSVSSTDDSSSVTLALQRTETEASLSVGYSPIIQFQVSDINARVNAALKLGATLDGGIQYEPHGAVAALRAPDGIMLGLYEPND